MATAQEDLHVAKARSLSDFELHNLTGFYDGTPAKSAALVELARRKFWRDFWTHGIIAWIALVISIASLIMNVWINFFQG